MFFNIPNEITHTLLLAKKPLEKKVSHLPEFYTKYWTYFSEIQTTPPIVHTRSIQVIQDHHVKNVR
jgi:hypothetical protein